MTQRRLFKEPVVKEKAEVAKHVCTVCGARWECNSRSCLENEQTICHKCPMGLPLCGLMEKK